MRFKEILETPYLDKITKQIAPAQKTGAPVPTNKLPKGPVKTQAIKSPLNTAAMIPGTLQPATSRYDRKVRPQRKEWVTSELAQASSKTRPDETRMGKMKLEYGR